MRWVAAAGIAILLAGCSERAAEAQSAALDPALGVLQGVVVDVAIRPVAGAAIVMTPGGLNATTGDDGLFRFEGIAPGSYALRVTRAGYVEQSLTVDAVAGQGPTVRVQLELVPSGLRYAQTYKFEGYYECGAWPTNGCANVNIVTGIMLCETPVPCFNVTGDRSVFLQWVDPGMGYLQTELAWQATVDTLGESLEFGVGGANREELQRGVAPSYNGTDGPSPLMVALDQDTLNESRIGYERALLVQVGSGAMPLVPGGCVVVDPCGPGVHLQQRFTNFTTTFYGYVPPPGWLFSVDGDVPPPPPE